MVNINTTHFIIPTDMLAVQLSLALMYDLHRTHLVLYIKCNEPHLSVET